MEKFQQTTVKELIIGDRFYKASDKQKKVWELVPSKKLTTKYQTYDYSALKDGLRHPEYLKADTAVIFLRNKDFI